MSPCTRHYLNPAWKVPASTASKTYFLDLRQFCTRPRDEAAELIMEELRELPLDGDGRIVLPDEFISKAHLKDQATFVGRGWKFQLWEPSSLAVVKQEKLRRVAASLKPADGETA